jgi:hypothetical protein
MKNKTLLMIITISIFVFSIITNTSLVSAVNYPYSVEIGDKLDYHVDILKNGTVVKPAYVYGLNLTEGDNFQMEIFDGMANSTSYTGADFTVRFLKDSETSIKYPGTGFLYTNNATFWESYTDTKSDIGGQIYQLTRSNNSISYSWTQNADNFVKIQFDPNTGIISTYERKSDSPAYNYTHFKFSKGTGDILSNIPGFEYPVVLVSFLTFVTISIQLKRKK